VYRTRGSAHRGNAAIDGLITRSRILGFVKEKRVEGRDLSFYYVGEQARKGVA